MWRDDERGGELLFEQPVIVHCYTARRFVTAKAMDELAAFLHRFGREANQGEVGMVIDGEYFAITELNE